MLFNSLVFPIFFCLVLTAYWLLGRQRHRNLLLLAASLVFYGWWDYRFLGLLLLSSGIDYCAALGMGRANAPRRLLLGLSLAGNLGILGAFKYYNFFSASMQQLLESMGMHPSWPTLHVILPMGISFYTFQALSYTIDVYRYKTPVCKDPINFFLFITFFPQLVAGPIEQSSALMPQFHTRKRFDLGLATTGLRYILWGFVLKCVLADNLGGVVKTVYDAAAQASPLELLLATYCFAFQIYGDFAGYTYIAIGTASLLGFHLSQNFRAPYLSLSVKEFWTRWHITLSSWFRDYVYIMMLGGSRLGRVRQVVNVLITFLLSGLWHGANWTFVAWGFLNGVFYFTEPARPAQTTGQRVCRCLVTFHLICLGWIFFRCDHIADALAICQTLFTPWAHTGAGVVPLWHFLFPLALIGLLVGAELIQQAETEIVAVDWMPRYARLALYYSLILAFVFVGEFSRRPFIYFQF